jgi:tetratricopeptide (TPR) repeat protein
VAIARELGVPSYEVAALRNLAHTSTVAGRHDRSLAACLRGIELGRRLGDICGEALVFGMLGDAYRGLGRYEDAVSSLRRALPVFRVHSSRRYLAVCLMKLGYAYEAMGSPEAIGYLEESLRIFRQLHLPRKVDQAQQALDRCRAALMAT